MDYPLFSKSRDLNWVLPERSKRQRGCGKMENMICWSWMYLCRTVVALNFAKKFGLHQRCRLFFWRLRTKKQASLWGWILAVMTILQNRSNWEFLFQGLMPYFVAQILFRQWIRNCSRMVSKFFCCKDRFLRMEYFWI